MQIHEIKRKNKNKAKKTGGRGGKRGKTSGRGTKGQNARAGRKKRPELRDIIKKLPKMRGYKFNSIQKKSFIVKIEVISKAFKDGDVVTPASLIAKKIVKQRKGMTPDVKILGNGEIGKKLTVSGCSVSASAKEKIEKAGGMVK